MVWIQTALEGFKFADNILGSKTSGYTELYPTRERDNSMLIVMIFTLVIIVVVFLLIFLKRR